MLTQPSTSAIVNALETGVSPHAFSASGVVLPSVDLILATGGAGGITLSLTEAIYPTNSPQGPLNLFQVYHAVKVDAGAGPVAFNDLSGAKFNGADSYELVDQWQFAVFMWAGVGVGWIVFGN